MTESSEDKDTTPAVKVEQSAVKAEKPKAEQPAAVNGAAKAAAAKEDDVVVKPKAAKQTVSSIAYCTVKMLTVC